MTWLPILACVIFILAAIAAVLHAKHAMRTSTSVVGAVCWALIDMTLATGSAVGALVMFGVMILR